VSPGAPTGVEWTSLPAPQAPSIPCACVIGKGSILTGTAPETPSALPVGEDGKILVACSFTPTGLTWESLPPSPPPAIPCSCVTGKGVVITGTASQQPAALPVGTNGQVLTACGLCETGLAWSTLPSVVPPIPLACLTNRGVLVSANAPGVAISLTPGTDGQVLMACSSCCSGLRWGTIQTTGIPTTIVTEKGQLLAGSAPNTPVALPVGTDGQTLRANSACSAGLEWSNVGKTVSSVANAGVIALTLDNLRVCFTATGNRTWAFGLTSGCETVITQSTCASGTAMATQRVGRRLDSTALLELGWNFTTAAGCATYLLWLGTSTTPRALYCFTGFVGPNYANNVFSLTRLY
jgi:hypothetical protein